MFCPECGSKNADDAVFCENCGANIAAAVQEAQQEAPQTGTEQSAEQMPQESTSPAEISPAAPAVASAYVPVSQTARKPLKTAAKVTIAAVAAVVVAGIVLFQVGQSQSSPDKVAMDYFGSLQAQDWNAAYQKLDVGGGEFLTEKNFETVQKQSTDDGKIMSYEVSPIKASDSYNHGSDVLNQSPNSVMMKHVVIEYMTKGSSFPKRQVLSLVKQPGKKWLFFDSWKISSEDSITPELSITVPDGVTVTLNDIKLSSKYIVKDEDSDSNDKESMVTYSVKKIFTGNYKIKITSPNTEDFTHSTDIDDLHSKFILDASDLKLKQSCLNSVAKQSEDIFKVIYFSALAGKDFDSISSNFVSDPEDQNLFKSSYNDIKKHLIATGTNAGFKSINFTSFDSKADQKSSSLQSIVVNTKVNYSFTAIPDSLFAETPPAPYNGKDSSTFQMQFRNEKGKWLVDDMSDIGLSFANGYLDQY